ncbi:transposase [Methylosinus sporium]|uniref:Transposase n=1 Tax=Methylosinus sporium TaxID=428 RepID=A0A549SEX8_METSR|nr:MULTISPECIES: transposase [Methylosinus]MBU3890390.1 transposase [Methylosinus sp. KRF6]TRL27764.1 transposase [Methylosinus sporium]
MSRNDDGPPALERKRRSWAMDEKRRIVDESLEEGASIAEVARRRDLNTNQLFTWRRQFGVVLAAPQELTPILPVTITPDSGTEYSSPGSTGQMEIVLAEGDRIIVWADGRGVAASFMLGAAGVEVGSRFLVAEECPIHANYKNAIVAAAEGDTVPF